MTGKETHNKSDKKEVPLIICPDCVRQGFVADPRNIKPDIYVVESICRVHRLIKAQSIPEPELPQT